MQTLLARTLAPFAIILPLKKLAIIYYNYSFVSGNIGSFFKLGISDVIKIKILQSKLHWVQHIKIYWDHSKQYQENEHRDGGKKSVSFIQVLCYMTNVSLGVTGNMFMQHSSEKMILQFKPLSATVCKVITSIAHSLVNKL